MAAIQSRLRIAAGESGFRDGAIDEFIASLPRLLDPDERLTYEGYTAHGLRDLVARFVAPSDRGFATAAYVEIGQGTDLAQLTASVAAANSSMTFTGIPVVNAILAAQFRRQFFLGLAAGTAMVFVLILVTFRRIDLTLIAISPTLLGLIWAGALLACVRTKPRSVQHLCRAHPDWHRRRLQHSSRASSRERAWSPRHGPGSSRAGEPGRRRNRTPGLWLADNIVLPAAEDARHRHVGRALYVSRRSHPGIAGPPDGDPCAAVREPPCYFNDFWRAHALMNSAMSDPISRESLISLLSESPPSRRP